MYSVASWSSSNPWFYVYETHPALWDVSCSEYRNKELKNETFQCTLQEIGRKLHNLQTHFFLGSPFFQCFVQHTICNTLLFVHVHSMNTQDKLSSFETALLELL